MGPKKRDTSRCKSSALPSPAVKAANELKRKYGLPATPDKGHRVRRALYDIEQNKETIRKAARRHGLSFGFLYRRLSGEVKIDSTHGSPAVFSKQEEESMAKWLSEMAERGMGLRPGEFLDFVQSVVTKENRQTPFINNRPSYNWYQNFLKRNSHVVQSRSETPLEYSRAKLTNEKMDSWYGTFRDFLISHGLIDKPSRIWNADETASFSMASNAGKVIGPARSKTSSHVPHVSGGSSKQRLTVMFCGSADGRMIPPFMVYPEPRPRGYNPLSGGIEHSSVEYIKKGWMDSVTFRQFINHFDQHCGTERPVVLLIDSVSSHVDMASFEEAKAKGIEVYRIVPNATHLMQPLDKGVFGPLKSRWHQVVRKHTREHPANPIGKENFAEKLKEAFLLFYKPLTVINSFRSSGIYPVDRNVISSTQLKPGITFTGAAQDIVDEIPSSCKRDTSDESNAAGALKALESVLATPVRDKYSKRIEEGYDIAGASPLFDAYKKLHTKVSSQKTDTSPKKPRLDMDMSGLDLLAKAAETVSLLSPEIRVDDVPKISPTLEEALVFPSVEQPPKTKQKRLLDTLPDKTSKEAIRTMALKQLEKTRAFAERERKAKEKYLRNLSKSKNAKSNSDVPSVRIKRKGIAKTVCKGVTNTGRNKSTTNSAKSEDLISSNTEILNSIPHNTSSSYDGQESLSNRCSEKQNSENTQRATKQKKKKSVASRKVTTSRKASCKTKAKCMGCYMSWSEDDSLDRENQWIQCHKCRGWIHSECCNLQFLVRSREGPFLCPECRPE